MSKTRALTALLVSLLCAACSKHAEPPAAQPAAPAPAAGPATASTVREFKIGELAAIALSDGGLQFPNDAKTFGVGHTPEEVAEVLRAAGAPTAELSLSIQPLLVKAGDKVLLFDTGAGANMGASGGKLAASLSEAGINAASVTDIFISHVHGDHIGGVIDASGAPLFANAAIHMSAPEWEFLKSMDEKAAANVVITNHPALMAAVTPKIDAFAPGSDILPGLVKAVDIKGHTPGHSGYLITSGPESLLYIGDTAHHYVISVQKPEWTINFDTDGPTALASRKELIERNATSGQRIYAVHFPFPGLGKFEKHGEGFAWMPEQ